MVRKGNRRYHDRVAKRYDSMYDGPYWRFYREISWRHLRPYLPEQRPAWAADLGCGTGSFGLRLMKSGLSVVFADPSGSMLGAAREAAEREQRQGLETRFLQLGMEDLSGIEDESLDFVTAQGDPLSFCEDPKRALRELRRVMRKGASCVLSVDSRVAGVRSLLSNKSPDAALELLRSGRTRWLAQRSEESFPMKMFDPKELDALLDKTGFEPRSKIAKTCIVQRQNEAWLEDPAERKRLLRAEEQVHGLPHYFGLAGHFQVAATRR